MTLLLCYIFQNHPAWKKKNLHYFKMKKNLQLLFHNVPSLKNTLFFTKLTNVQVAPFKTFCWDIPKIIGLSIIYYFLQRVFPFSRYTNGTFHWRNGSVKIGIGTITQMRRVTNTDLFFWVTILQKPLIRIGMYFLQENHVLLRRHVLNAKNPFLSPKKSSKWLVPP